MVWQADGFLAQLRNQPPLAAYLFLGPESYRRDACRRALLERVLPPDDREGGYTRLDLEQSSLAEVVDDARSYSLFAPKRVIWVSRAEAALPRGKAADAEEETPASKGGAELLAAYLKDPTPGVTIVLDSARFEFDGEDKAKTERVRKFYSMAQGVVEFPRFNAQQARRLAGDLAREAGLRISNEALDMLVESTGASALGVAREIEKLSLWTAGQRTVSAGDIEQMVPQARSTTIFVLVAALGRNDRAGALDALDTLVRQGEYLPLALSFLATQLRHALVAQESGLRGAKQIQEHFAHLGVPMWPSRAEQVRQTLAAFSGGQMKEAIRRIAEADKNLRGARPDERVILEELVIGLTGGGN